MVYSLADFFDSERFMPHGHCFLWQPDILWLHVLSDASIVAAYFLIPFALLGFIMKRSDLPFQRVFLLFGAFILLCGLTHALDIWVLWHPDYAIQGVVKALTAIVSLATAFFTFKLIPQALLLPSPARLAAINSELLNLHEQNKKTGQAHLRAVVDNALDGLISIDARGIVESFNPACERIFGYKAEEVVGRNIKMLMPEPYHREHDGYLSHYHATGEAKIIGTPGREVRGRRKDGSTFPIDLSVSAFELEDGKHFSGILRDITARKDAEQKLREEAARLSAVMNTVLDGLITIDQHGTIMSFNPAAVKIFDYQPEDVIGQNVKILMPEPYHGEHDGYLKNYMGTGEAKVIGIGREVSGRRRNGSVFPMELGVNEAHMDGGRMFVGTIRDITDRKRMQQELMEREELYRVLIDGIGDYAIYMLDTAGKVKSWSNSAESIKGYTAEEIIGQHFSIFFTPEQQAEGAPKNALQIAATTGRYEAEALRIRKDGTAFWANMIVNALHSRKGELLGFAKITRDISQSKMLEQQREQMIGKLTESNTELERFAYICSHDLQEPLRMISNFSQRLENHLGGTLDDKAKHYMKYVVDGAAHARQMISDVLNYARLSHDTEQLATIDSKLILEGVLQDLSMRIQETGARITYDALPILRIQPTHLRQLLQNLISNAIKFCKETPSVHIGVAREGDFWRFSVRDNGIGIAPEHLGKLFTIFQRLHNREQYPGTGIGLAVCKKVTQKYDGKIWLESKQGEGSTFFFTLPCQADEHLAEAAE